MAKQKSVPTYSQFLDVIAEDWQHRACGVVALKMLMEFLGARVPTSDQLIREGLSIHAYENLKGWTHQGLANLARRHHLHAAPMDWNGKPPSKAFQELKQTVRNAPCIASIYKNFRKRNGGGHLIVVTRISGSEVFYNDPESHLRQAIRRSTSIERFMKGWKRRIIVVKG